MRCVAAAFAAVSERRFDELAPLISPQIDWRGVPDGQTGTPRCHGRASALERMRVGLLARDGVSVSAFVEEGDRVLAHVHAASGAAADLSERFVVAEVHDGQISHLRGYVSESEAQAALRSPVLSDASAPADGA